MFLGIKSSFATSYENPISAQVPKDVFTPDRWLPRLEPLDRAVVFHAPPAHKSVQGAAERCACCPNTDISDTLKTILNHF